MLKHLFPIGFSVRYVQHGHFSQSQAFEGEGKILGDPTVRYVLQFGPKCIVEGFLSSQLTETTEQEYKPLSCEHLSKQEKELEHILTGGPWREESKSSRIKKWKKLLPNPRPQAVISFVRGKFVRVDDPENPWLNCVGRVRDYEVFYRVKTRNQFIRTVSANSLAPAAYHS